MPDAPGDAADVLVGGRYRLHDVLGEGGMGAVWRATDELLGRTVAIKRVRLGTLPPADAERARERTMREARIAAALHHPHVVTIFDVVIEDGEPWLILEYVPSRSLGAILREHGTLAPSDVAGIGAQVAAGLAAAHAAGVVHRDVKPDNVLIAGSGHGGDPEEGGPGGGQLRALTTAKLTDFGISRAAQSPDITAADILSGTPAYFAPEAARGEGTGPRTDMYSLGATLYAAVEGHPPFGSDHGNVLALLTRVGRGAAPPPRRAGPLTEILRDLISDDPAVRPTAAAAQLALQVLASERSKPVAVGRPVAVAPDPTLHIGSGTAAKVETATSFVPTVITPETFAPVHRPPSSRRKVVAAVAVLAVVVSGVTLALTAGGPSTDEPATPAMSATATAEPSPQVASPIRIADQRAADPCSLLDIGALGRYGAAVRDDSVVPFAGCGAVVTPPDGLPLGVTIEFETAAQAAQAAQRTEGTPEQVGPVTVARYPPSGPRCARRVLLPDGNAALLSATGKGTDAAQICAIADTSVTATVDTLAQRGIGTRNPAIAELSPLAATDACGLLDPAELRSVPGINVAGRPGFGNWSCEWASRSGAYVRVAYARRPPLTPEDGKAADFAGRPGVMMLTAGSDCFAQFGQRTFVGEGGSARIDAVQLFVYRSLPDDQLCSVAGMLASAAAGRLPPSS